MNEIAQSCPEPSPRRLSAFTLPACAAAVLIGHALTISDGQYDATALEWITAGMALAVLGLVVHASSPRNLAIGVCIGGLIWQIEQNLSALPVLEISNQYVLLLFYDVAMPLMAVAAVGAVLLTRYSKTLFVPLLLLTHFVTGAALLHYSRTPLLDVFAVCRNSCQALSRGECPYATDFANPAYGPWQQSFFPPGSVVNGRVELGYPYLPVDLLVEWLSHAVTGDFRYGLLLAFTLAGGLLAYCGPGPLPAAAAGLLLLTPRGFFAIQQSWVDPIVVCCMAGVLYCACRKPRWTATMLGLLLASKQDMFLALPASLLLLPRPWQWPSAVRFVRTALLVAAATVLPLVVWNPRAFWHSAVWSHLNSPFRSDSLNFAAVWFNARHAPPPDWLSFVLAALAMLAAIRASRSPAGFAMAVAVIYLCFFAVLKQAFCNYYVFSIGALCCAIAGG